MRTFFLILVLVILLMPAQTADFNSEDNRELKEAYMEWAKTDQEIVVLEVSCFVYEDHASIAPTIEKATDLDVKKTALIGAYAYATFYREHRRPDRADIFVYNKVGSLVLLKGQTKAYSKWVDELEYYQNGTVTTESWLTFSNKVLDTMTLISGEGISA